MSSALILILVVVGAYLAAHVAFEWLARKYAVISGAEYLLLGILMGPEVSGLISTSAVGGFAPFITLSLGWIGAVVGAQFYLPALIRIPAVYYRVAFLEAMTTLVVVSGIMVATLVGVYGISWLEAVLPAVALGAIATASSPTGVALVSRGVKRSAPVVRQLEVATAIDSVVAIVAFGLLLSIFHAAPANVVRAPTATEWAVIGIAIGVVGGILFHLFLGGETAVDRLFIGLTGAIILASGAAAYLRLSPLLPTLLIGAILVNTTGTREEIKEVLSRVERPLYFVLLIFAGAAWRPSDQPWLFPVVAFLVARAATKIGGSWIAAKRNGLLDALGPGWGRALLGHGGLAVAIALNYRIDDYPPLADTVFTAAIVSVLITDISSARLVASVIRPLRRRGVEQKPAQARGTGEK